MTARDEQINVIDQELRRLERRIEELRHAKDRIRAERAEVTRCYFCGTGIHPGATLCAPCSMEQYT